MAGFVPTDQFHKVIVVPRIRHLTLAEGEVLKIHGPMTTAFFNGDHVVWPGEALEAWRIPDCDREFVSVELSSEGAQHFRITGRKPIDRTSIFFYPRVRQSEAEDADERYKWRRFPLFAEVVVTVKRRGEFERSRYDATRRWSEWGAVDQSPDQ